MMLSYEREDDRGQIRFEGESGQQPLVDWRILWQEHVECYLDPGGLHPLSGMIEPRELRKILLRVAKPWVCDGVDHSHPVNAAQVFFRER